MDSGQEVSFQLIADDGREGPQSSLYRPRQGNIFKTAWTLLNNVYDGYQDRPMMIVRSSRSQSDVVEMTNETEAENPFWDMMSYGVESLPAVRPTNSDNSVTMSSQKEMTGNGTKSEELIQIDATNNFIPTSAPSSSIGPQSGVTVILDDSSVTHHREPRSIINKGESKSCGKFSPIARNHDPNQYIRLSELFQSETRVLSETFLESVNDQIRHMRLANEELRANQLSPPPPQESTEKTESPGNNCSLNAKSSSGGNNVNLTVSLTQVQGSTGATVEIGRPTTVGINVPSRKTEDYVSEPPPHYPSSWTSTNATALENVIITRPNIPVEVSRADEGSGIAESRLDSATSTPLSMDQVDHFRVREEERTPMPKMSYEGDANKNWANYFSISNALTYTGKSIKSVYEAAEDIVSTFIIPPDPNVMTVEEMNDGEDKIAISVMRLMGIPQQTRHNIYHEALQEVQVLHDVSTGTFDFLHNIANWLCTGDLATKDAFLAKTRILATMTSEVEADSEVWRQFEKDVLKFTKTVTNLVKGSIAGAQGIANTEERQETFAAKERVEEESVQTVSISFLPVTDNNEDHQTDVVQSQTDENDYDVGQDEEYTYLQLSTNPFLDNNNNEYSPQEKAYL